MLGMTRALVDELSLWVALPEATALVLALALAWALIHCAITLIQET